MSKMRIVKEKNEGCTFTGDSLDLAPRAGEPESDRKDDAGRDYRLRVDRKLDKIKHKSKLTGGHSMQGHSPVYE
jgi:hypothetical protein